MTRLPQRRARNANGVFSQGFLGRVNASLKQTSPSVWRDRDTHRPSPVGQDTAPALFLKQHDGMENTNLGPETSTPKYPPAPPPDVP